MDEADDPENGHKGKHNVYVSLAKFEYKVFEGGLLFRLLCT